MAAYPRRPSYSANTRRHSIPCSGNSCPTDPMVKIRSQITSAMLILGMLIASGCWRSPEARKANYLKRADAYFAEERYHDAFLESLTLLPLDPTNVPAIKNVGSRRN